MSSLYCILARAADRAVIFRRGPSKFVRLISWNLKNNTFEPGQWFKGQIYVRKSDLSPDGTKLVYFAAKHKGELPTWIAISTPPYLTAHVLWRGVGTWNDLSLFETDSQLALATSRFGSLEPEPGFQVPRQLVVKEKPWPGYFHKLADHERLVRDGWSIHSGVSVYHPKGPNRIGTYRKPVLQHSPAYLEMSATSDAKVSYQLDTGNRAPVSLDADWADVHRGNILFSRGAKLFITSVTRVAFGPEVELADFTDMKFEAIEAPGWAVKW